MRLSSSASNRRLFAAPNDLEMLGMVSRWIDEHSCARRSLIGLHELPEGHAGPEWAFVVAGMIYQYCIGDKLGYFQIDKAANNATALRALSQRFVIEEHEQRLRCSGHVVNLVVKSLLFGEGLTRFTKELKDASDCHAFKIWRSKGAIGELHNFVVYITRSNQRVQAFNRAQIDAADDLLMFYLRPKKDTGIRWNSIYTMIERALVLEDALRLLGFRWSGSKAGERGDTGFSKEDILDTHDWEELRHFKVLLEPFYLATKRVERYASGGTHGAIWEVLPAFELL
jgi:hypothetical protein